MKPTMICFLVVSFATFLSIESGAQSKQVSKPKCNPVPYHQIQFSEVKGIRTRWEVVLTKEQLMAAPRNEGRGQIKDDRYSFTPNMGGLWPSAWYQALSVAGANMAELNIDPSRELKKISSLSNEEIIKYQRAFMVPYARRSEVQQELVERVRSIIAKQDYTPDQRDLALLMFLARLENSRKAGKIAGVIPFLLHQRLWFRENETPATRSGRIKSFSEDVSRFINLARSQCLDHWIAGVRLGEHSNTNMQDLLISVILPLTQEINRQTDGWLKSRLFLANGGGWGVEYSGIASVHGFYKKIVQETDGFAFGYKFMSVGAMDERADGMGNLFKNYCQEGRCDTSSVEDWKFFLRSRGFSSLRYFINQSAVQYPRHANVIFVGDSSDSSNLLTDEPKGKMVEKPPLKAIRALFNEAAAAGLEKSWSGKHFTLFSNTQEGVNDPHADVGFSLIRADLDSKPLKPDYNPQTRALWAAWPKEP